MKGLFPQFDNANVVDHTATWNDALFVFDTNILLNLYRYQQSTREELINILQKLSSRVWIPHHVALEFQRNRLSVISAQGRRFSELRTILTKAQTSLSSDISKLSLQKRHALIDSDALLSEFGDLVRKFQNQLDEQQEAQQKPMEKDFLKYRIEELFEGKVGEPFKDQKSVDCISKSAEARYKCRIPPGYEDREKDRTEPDEFLHNGIVYKRKYGDYFAWVQILEHAKEKAIKSLIFVTDDGKEDWWSIVDFNGPKTIGARPELIEEISTASGVDQFIMYKPEGFLKYAKTYLEASVSQDTLDEVRDLSWSNKNLENSSDPVSFYALVDDAAYKLLISRHRNVTRNWIAYPDFIIERPGYKLAYESKAILSADASIFKAAILQGKIAISHEDFSTLNIMFVLHESVDADIAYESLLSERIPDIPSNLIVSIGELVKTSDGLRLEMHFEDNYINLFK